MVWSVSATTRQPRQGETGGRSYEFLTEAEFQRREQAGEFLETAEYVGHRYGTPRAPVERALERGDHVVMEIEVQGGIQVARKMPESIRIFVLPPSMESLRARLAGRKTEADEVMAKRLEAADGEIAAARDSGCYDYFVVNDELQTTIDEIKRILSEDKRTT